MGKNWGNLRGIFQKKQQFRADQGHTWKHRGHTSQGRSSHTSQADTWKHPTIRPGTEPTRGAPWGHREHQPGGRMPGAHLEASTYQTRQSRQSAHPGSIENTSQADGCQGRTRLFYILFADVKRKITFAFVL